MPERKRITLMAYELVKDPDSPVSGKPGPALSPGHETPWYMNSDAGYGDTYRKLKQEMEHTYTLYRDQLNYLPRKKADLDREVRQKLRTMLLLLASPLILAVITEIFLHLAAASGAFGIFYLIAKLIQIAGSVIFVFFLLPGATGNYFNAAIRKKKLGMPAHSSIDEETTVNFADEEAFLRQTLSEYDRFNLRAAREDLEHLGTPRNDSACPEKPVEIADGLSDQQVAVLETMRTMSLHRDFQARIGDERKEAGPVSVIVGFGILIAVIAFLIIAG